MTKGGQGGSEAGSWAERYRGEGWWTGGHALLNPCNTRTGGIFFNNISDIKRHFPQLQMHVLRNRSSFDSESQTPPLGFVLSVNPRASHSRSVSLPKHERRCMDFLARIAISNQKHSCGIYSFTQQSQDRVYKNMWIAVEHTLLSIGYAYA